MDFIEVTTKREGQFIKILVNKKCIVSAIPAKGNKGTLLEVIHSNRAKIFVLEPYDYIKAMLTGVSNYRHEDDYDF